MKNNKIMVSLSLVVLLVLLSTSFALAFDSTDAEEEGYWYSRYNLGNLVMRSGMGDVVMPDQEQIMKAIAMVDSDFDPAEMQKGNSAYGDGDHALPPKNPAMLSTVYKSGDPHFITKFDVDDFATQRWDPEKMDKTLTGSANGYTILKEVEWARQFHVDDHFGTPDSDFGAYWRFVGMMMTMSAKMQTKSFLENKESYDLSNGGDAVMLMALSDLSDLLSVEKLAHSEVMNRYKDPAMAEMVSQGADSLFEQVSQSNPTSIKEKSLAIQSLVWYAAKTANEENKIKALNKISLLASSLESTNPTTASQRAYYLRGLIDAKRTLGVNDGSIRIVGAEFLDDFDVTTGTFRSQNSFTIDEVGEIIGTLNALRIFETADVDADLAEEVFKTFHEEVINKGGLQISAPPIKVAKSPFEYEGEPETYFRYDESQPFPPMAGGEFGIAPVFATSIAYKDGKWTVTDSTFDTAGAMHTSNEMIWLHYDEINGFPEVDVSGSLASEEKTPEVDVSGSLASEEKAPTTTESVTTGYPLTLLIVLLIIGLIVGIVIGKSIKK